MRHKCFRLRLTGVALTLTLLWGVTGQLNTFAQSRRQPPTTNQKKNKRPDGTQQPTDKQEETPPDLIGKPQDAETISVTTALVNVEVTVYHKKSGKIISGLKQENFAVYEDGQQKTITNFSTPEAPITLAMILEYSKLSNQYGSGFEPGRYEVLRPMALFLSQFIRPPDDYVSVIAYDLRPTPITDFTNDPQRIQQVINLMLRNYPAFRDSNLFDALKFTLIGGRGDSVVLENSKSQTSEYAGMVDIKDRRKAILLIASGLDTFSKINYGDTRKIVQNAGIPIYIIGTLNFFYKKYGDQIGAVDDSFGNPGRMSFLQAQNTLKTFANESGGAYYPITFEGEIPSVLQSINTLIRSQYSLGYNPGDEKRDGKQHKIVVKVDVDGDGKFDEKDYVVKHRLYYNAPKDDDKK